MRVCVCVCKGGGRDSRVDMLVRMRPLTVMCPHFFDTDMWHSWAVLPHVLKDRERQRARERLRERKRFANNAHWVGEAAAGGTCTDLEASYSGQDGGASPRFAFHPWRRMDGQFSASVKMSRGRLQFTEHIDECQQRQPFVIRTAITGQWGDFFVLFGIAEVRQEEPREPTGLRSSCQKAWIRDDDF